MFTLRIETDNAAFGEQEDNSEGYSDDAVAEVARILRKCADKIENGVDAGNLMDVNGNKVGEFSF